MFAFIIFFGEGVGWKVFQIPVKFEFINFLDTNVLVVFKSNLIFLSFFFYYFWNNYCVIQIVSYKFCLLFLFIKEPCLAPVFFPFQYKSKFWKQYRQLTDKLLQIARGNSFMIQHIKENESKWVVSKVLVVLENF